MAKAKRRKVKVYDIRVDFPGDTPGDNWVYPIAPKRLIRENRKFSEAEDRLNNAPEVFERSEMSIYYPLIQEYLSDRVGFRRENVMRSLISDSILNPMVLPPVQFPEYIKLRDEERKLSRKQFKKFANRTERVRDKILLPLKKAGLQKIAETDPQLAEQISLYMEPSVFNI